MLDVDRPRATRRGKGAVRHDLLEAARQVFSRAGYAASTRSIAAEAEVSESLIFVHFGTKAGLFEAAVLEPFASFVDEFVHRWRSEPRTASLADETRYYVQNMYDLFRRHRKLVLALIAVDAFEGDALEGKVGAVFARLVKPIEDELVTLGERRGWTGYDPTVIRPMLGMIMSTAVHDNLLYSDDNRRSQAHVVAQLTDLILYGATGERR